MQKDLLNKEIKNILYGFADCLMYKTGQVGGRKIYQWKDDIWNRR